MNKRPPVSVHQRQDLSRMYTVQLVSKGSRYDTLKTHKSNRLILLTCAEYIVMDLRDENDRAREPLDMAFYALHSETFEQFNIEIQQLMLKGEKNTLRAILDVIPPNKYATEIRRYLTEGRIVNERAKRDTRPKITIRPNGRAASVQAEVLPRYEDAVGEVQRIRIVSDNGTGGSDSDD